MMNDAQSDILRSDRLRADQCRVATEVTADPRTDIDPLPPIVAFGGDGGIVIAHDRVVAERRNDARAVGGGAAATA